MAKALIVWGGWPGHEPQVCADVIGAMLRDEGFRVEISGDPSDVGSPALERYDLLIPIVTGETLGTEAALRLQNAVRNGLGLCGFHAALATSFKACAPFRFLAGVTWVAHPGDMIDFTVNIVEPADPVMTGIQDFDYHSEQYYRHFDPSVDVLATTTFSAEHDPAVAGITMPVVFKRPFGKGRIFYSALGHFAVELEHPQGREILRRGLLWAARTS